MYIYIYVYKHVYIIHFLSPGMEPWQNAKGLMSEEEMQACHLAKLSPGPFFFCKDFHMALISWSTSQEFKIVLSFF